MSYETINCHICNTEVSKRKTVQIPAPEGVTGMAPIRACRTHPEVATYLLRQESASLEPMLLTPMADDKRAQLILLYLGIESAIYGEARRIFLVKQLSFRFNKNVVALVTKGLATAPEVKPDEIQKAMQRMVSWWKANRAPVRTNSIHGSAAGRQPQSNQCHKHQRQDHSKDKGRHRGNHRDTRRNTSHSMRRALPASTTVFMVSPMSQLEMKTSLPA